MGRKKITITRIQDERNRQITFSKRKAGLLKKAYELSILCDVEIAVIMITSNKKLYQYASSNMNSILIRYTEFKDPDESKTNADILDDITKKEKGGGGQDESGEEDSGHSNFLVTPHTQESYRKIDEEFDTLLRQNQIPQQPVQSHGIQTPLGSAPASIPAVMPVSVPVSSTNTVHRQIHQHLKGQLETQKSSGSSAGPLSSASSGSLFSPQSDLSSASPAVVVGNKTGQKSPMPPPQNTPTRLQMIRNQTLKLHLPGSGRNYISLPGPGSSKSATEEGVADSPEDLMGEEPDGKDEGAGGGGEKGGRPGSKPQLRVYIPGQKEFVPRTQATSPLAQVGLNNAAAGGGGASEAAGAEGGGGGGGGMGQAPAIANQTTTSTESLTTPILSLATPNMFSSLPPLFSSFMGDFPFGQIPGGASAGGGAGGGGASAMGTAGGGHPDLHNIEATLKAINRRGALSHTVIHGVFVGPARSGKNSLMENLLGHIPPFKTPSTGVAEAVVQVQVETLTTVAATVDKGSVWSRIDDNDEVIRLISMHSDPNNVQYEQDDSVIHDYETGAGVRLKFNFPNPPKKYDDTPLEILTRAIESKGLGAIQKFFDTSWSLYLSNTGGQIEFQEILPILVSGPCIFFYTFRLDRDFNEYYTIEYELQDGTKLELYKSTLTTIEGIQQSLASIAAMGIFVYQGREKKEVQLRPKVFFIGTHRDLLPSNSAESIIADKDQHLQESTRQFVDIIEFASSSQMIFTVDNFSEDKSAFQKIRSAVDRAVERHEFEMVCPSHWLIFSFALRRFEQETVSYEECFEVAKQCGIIDEEELNDALHFIHTKMGLIRYFHHDCIKDIVIVKPQLLYDKISELIVKTFTFDKAGKHSADVFKENGIFSVAEFERICHRNDEIRRNSEGSMKAPQFAKLLEKLRITAPLERDGDKVTKYFIPCILAHAAKPKEQIETMILSAEIPPFAIIFKCGYCPKGLGGALISYLMAIENPNFEWKLLTDCIFRDQVSFEVGPLDTVVLKILSSHLIIACIPNSKRRLRRDCSIEDVCINVRKTVEAGIKQVALDIDFIDSEIEHSLTFLCPCDECQSRYPAEMKNFNGKPHCLRCTKTRVRFELPQGYEKWFNAKSQRQAASITQYYFKEDDLNDIMSILTKHAAQWREIGMGLKFTEYELDNIENMPRLLFNAPISTLREMISKWLQWAPRDNRGSTSFATLEALKDGLNIAGLAATANDLSISFEHKLTVHVAHSR